MPTHLSSNNDGLYSLTSTETDVASSSTNLQVVQVSLRSLKLALMVRTFALNSMMIEKLLKPQAFF